MRYSPERKEAVLKKMMPLHNRSVKQLAIEEGISEATLYNWRQEARAKGILLPDGDSGPEGWNARDKFAAVMESASLNDQDTAEYCRRKGIYPHQLEQWRKACENANDWDRQANIKLKSEQKTNQKRIKDLEKELQRKEKALAEAATLLVLQKKSTGDLGRVRGRMISIADRRKTVELINTAHQAGSRLAPACRPVRSFPPWRIREPISPRNRAFTRSCTRPMSSITVVGAANGNLLTRPRDIAPPVPIRCGVGILHGCQSRSAACSFICT